MENENIENQEIKQTKQQTAIWISKPTRDLFKAQRKILKMKTEDFLLYLLIENSKKMLAEKKEVEEEVKEIVGKIEEQGAL